MWPRLGRLASRSGGCGPVGQATETIMGRKNVRHAGCFGLWLNLIGQLEVFCTCA